MENKMLKNMRRVAGGKNILENIALVLLAFYPLRHISWGLDLWDTGYNYANFQYMGTEHMDPMWLFSTYLANAAGNLLTRLPNGGTLLGMNLYTALFASALGLLGYFFCTRALRIPKPAAFAGEFIALSLCWCPTALLYNYLTYILFLGCVILLYYGLVKEKKGCLIAAGACLGTNVLVRFSNLPEMAMIVAVWAYDVILWLEGRKEGKGWRRLLSHTGWCLLGYAAALAVLLGWIQLRYGLDEYGAGIARAFCVYGGRPCGRAAGRCGEKAGRQQSSCFAQNRQCRGQGAPCRGQGTLGGGLCRHALVALSQEVLLVPFSVL